MSNRVVSSAVFALVAALYEVVSTLAVSVANTAVLAVDGRPRRVNRQGVDARQPQMLRPKGCGVGGNAHRRLHKMIVNAHSELAACNHGLALICYVVKQFAAQLLHIEGQIAARRRHRSAQTGSPCASHYGKGERQKNTSFHHIACLLVTCFLSTRLLLLVNSSLVTCQLIPCHSSTCPLSLVNSSLVNLSLVTFLLINSVLEGEIVAHNGVPSAYGHALIGHLRAADT